MKKLIFLFFLVLALYFLSDKISNLQSKYNSIIFGENKESQVFDKKEENQNVNIEKLKSKNEEKKYEEKANQEINEILGIEEKKRKEPSFIEKIEEYIKIIKEKFVNIWRKE